MNAALPLTPDAAIEIEPFHAGHKGDAARLFTARLDALRSDVPVVEPIAADRLGCRLEGLADQAAGVVAFAAGRPIGYLAAFGVEGVRGPGMAAYVPEWAWAVAPDAPRDTFTRMYAEAARAWIERGWQRHVVTSLALDGPLGREMAWLGFAPCVMDAILDLRGPTAESFVQTPAGMDVRRAEATDADQIAELRRRLDDHLTASPTFLHRPPGDGDRSGAPEWPIDPARAIFVARSGEDVTAFIELAEEGDGVAEIVRHPGLAHVVAAFTRPEWRRHGVAEALLAAALADARERGFRAAAVDFETANPLARRFWARFFSPVCISYERSLR